MWPSESSCGRKQCVALGVLLKPFWERGAHLVLDDLGVPVLAHGTEGRHDQESAGPNETISETSSAHDHTSTQPATAAGHQGCRKHHDRLTASNRNERKYTVLRVFEASTETMNPLVSPRHGWKVEQELLRSHAHTINTLTRQYSFFVWGPIISRNLRTCG